MSLVDRVAQHSVAGVQAELRDGAEETHAEAPLREGGHAVPGVPMGVPHARSHRRCHSR